MDYLGQNQVVGMIISFFLKLIDLEMEEIKDERVENNTLASDMLRELQQHKDQVKFSSFF